MIDICLGNNEVEIEGTKHHSFNERDNLEAMLIDLIERCLYSGESITLRRDTTGFVKEWVNPHVSDREPYRK